MSACRCHGEKGVERVVEIDLVGAEKEAFNKSARRADAGRCLHQIAPELGKMTGRKIIELRVGGCREAVMNIHEYQAKAVLREFGVPTARCARFSVDEAVKAAERTGRPGLGGKSANSLPAGAARPAASRSSNRSTR